MKKKRSGDWKITEKGRELVFTNPQLLMIYYKTNLQTLMFPIYEQWKIVVNTRQCLKGNSSHITPKEKAKLMRWVSYRISAQQARGADNKWYIM